MEIIKDLNELEINETGFIDSVIGRDRTRLLQMGFVIGTKVCMKHKAPFKGPIRVCLRGSNVIMRQEEAKNIKIRKCEYESNCKKN